MNTKKQVIPENNQLAVFVSQAANELYNENPHVIKTIFYAAASILFGYGAIKEYACLGKPR